MSPLDGKRVLVVEDEALIAAMVEDMLVELGATVVGPASSIDQALVLVHSDDIDAAVLDVNIRSERVDPIAEILRVRNVPIVFATGYGSSTRGMNYSPAIEKPYTLEKLANALKTALLTAASR
jgi:two-component SAPR family response regulator